MKTKRLFVNFFANLLSFVISFGISFFLTPYVTEKLGSEAYGFISLGNNFVSYATIITSALNAMAARFITVSVLQKKMDDADIYFSSVLLSNVIISGVLLIPSSVFILFLDKFIDVPINMSVSVKILWFCLFLAFFVTLISSVFGVSPFVKNRTDLSAYRDVIQNIARALLLFGLFGFFGGNIWYYGIAALISSSIGAFINFRFHKKLLPEVSFKLNKFRKAAVYTLLSAGIWSSIGSLSSVLIDGLDLLIANVFIDATAMGVLSIAKTLPMAINGMISTIQQIFVPSFTISYVNKDEHLIDDINQAIKTMSIFSSVPIVVLIVLGKSFFHLWVPSQNADVLQILSILTIGVLIITSAIKPLYAVYTVTNKLKWNSITTLIQGVLSTTIVFICLVNLPEEIVNDSNNPWGLYIVAGVSTVFGILRALTFTPMYSAYCLGKKITIFYPAIFRSVAVTLVTSLIINGIVSLFSIQSWLALVLAALFVCCFTLCFGILLILNKRERKRLFSNINTVLIRRLKK